MQARAHAKLQNKELEVLSMEEDALRVLISQYKTQLNALKVEELTLLNQLGTTQDIQRKSRNSTPSVSRPHSSHRAQSTEFPSQKVTESSFDINKRTLNLTSEPLIQRMLKDQTNYEEEEDDN